MAAAGDDTRRLLDAGFMPYALDLSGQTLLAPDGLRLVTVEQAIREIEEQES